MVVRATLALVSRCFCSCCSKNNSRGQGDSSDGLKGVTSSIKKDSESKAKAEEKQRRQGVEMTAISSGGDAIGGRQIEENIGPFGPPICY